MPKGITCTVKNLGTVNSALKKIETISADLEKELMSDVKSRAPAWIGKGIREAYNISVAESKGGKDSKVTSKNVARVEGVGNTVAALQFEYTGRNLSYAISGSGARFSTKMGADKKIRVQVQRGKTRLLKSMPNFPFQIEGKTPIFYRSRKNDLYALRSIGLPQMVESKNGPNILTEGPIKKQMTAGMGPRLDHFISRAQGKINRL